VFNRRIYANSRPDGLGVLEVDTGAPSEGGRQFVPLRRTELRGEIVGPLAALHLVHTYSYSRQECDRVLEAAYRFPLPGDAAVTGVRVRFGAVEIATELQEREKAEAAYEAAVQQGKQAALLTRESPDVFTLRVAGIQPDQEVVIDTSYVQLARPRGDSPRWELRVPLTTAPRYVRQDELISSRPAQGQPLAVMRDPGHRFSLDLVIRAAGQMSSPTHRIEVLSVDDGADRRIRLYEEETLPDQDLVLEWTVHQEQDRPALILFLHDDVASRYIYFLALVTPPALLDPDAGIGREIALLVDHSGSMGGAKWEASDWTVNSFLSRLTDRDQFALGLFHNTTKWFSAEPCQATTPQIQAAAQFLDQNRDSGGTELGIALEQALHLKRVDRQARARHVLVITDAQVTDEARILRLADEERQHQMRRRISVLCIDAAPNAFLANELAERGGGVAYFLTSDPDQEDITTALEDVLADWAQPAQVGLRLEIERGRAEVSGREILERTEERTVMDLGDLSSGRATWVAGRVPWHAGKPLAFRLTAQGETLAASQAQAEAADRPALKALFGARRLLGLEYLINAAQGVDTLSEQLRRLGYDAQVVLDGLEPAVYAENARQAAHDALRALLVRESLAYGLACAETAFVAVRSEAGQPVQQSVIVGNALPSGWSEDFLGAGGSGMLMSAMPPAVAAPAPTGAMPRFAMAAPPAGPARALRGRGKAARRSGLEAEAPPAAGGGAIVVFDDAPSFVNGQATLFDSTQHTFPDQATISRVEVHWAEKAPGPGRIDREWVLLLFVDDMAVPRARIRLADMARLGGSRPVNLRKEAGQIVRVVLADPRGTWPAAAPRIVVSLTT